MERRYSLLSINQKPHLSVPMIEWRKYVIPLPEEQFLAFLRPPNKRDADWHAKIDAIQKLCSLSPVPDEFPLKLRNRKLTLVYVPK
jgi:hypothetical protein